MFTIPNDNNAARKMVRIETYGCQMNVADSEVVAATLQMAGYDTTENDREAAAVLLNTCSIRENAEQKIYSRIAYWNALRRKLGRNIIIGVIGCMAERLKQELIEKHGVDLVAGPDSYLDLPNLMAAAEVGEKAINVELSTTETYRDIVPRRIGGNGISGFISIMRGCNNFCSYCIVPYTRGRERSRDPESILRELDDLRKRGFKEVTLLGQNVDSYRFEAQGSRLEAQGSVAGVGPAGLPCLGGDVAAGPSQGDAGVGPAGLPCQDVDFAGLLGMVAERAPEMRIRFTTSHPKDLCDRTLETIAAHPNIARQIHLPVQSGSNKILKLMNRKYTREWYLDRIAAIRRIVPDAVVTTDLFTGFHNETEEDFEETLSLMREVGYASAFMFKYSERPGTFASKHLPDNVAEDVKIDRLNRMIALQNELSLASNRADMGREFEVLVEGPSKRNADELCGRTSGGKMAVFGMKNGGIKAGDFVRVKVVDATSATLLGEIV